MCELSPVGTEVHQPHWFWLCEMLWKAPSPTALPQQLQVHSPAPVSSTAGWESSHGDEPRSWAGELTVTPWASSLATARPSRGASRHPTVTSTAALMLLLVFLAPRSLEKRVGIRSCVRAMS